MYIQVRVTAGAKKELIEKVGENRLRISVKEKTERNQANRRVQALVAEYAGVPVKQARLINGHTSRTKLFSIINEAV